MDVLSKVAGLLRMQKEILSHTNNALQLEFKLKLFFHAIVNLLSTLRSEESKNRIV